MSASDKSTSREAPSQMQGEELVNELRNAWKPLPMATIMGMVMAGLRVRLMRSVVTMVSIVLAIVFLTYSGLANKLSYNLTLAAGELERFEAVDPQKLSQASKHLAQLDLIAPLSTDQQVKLARALEMDELSERQARSVELTQTVRDAQLRFASATKRLDALKALPDTPKAQMVVATRRLESAQEDLTLQKQKQDQVEQELRVARALRGNASGIDEVKQDLAQLLTNVQQRIFADAARPSRLSEVELERLGEMLPLAKSQAPEHAEHVEAALSQQRDSRSAAKLRQLLNAAGINIDATLKGNPLDTWLIIMALLTCTIGIANAMLMSVTERFREIGTMKCLGAQDSLVVKLFLLESAIQGGVGALAGIGLGTLIACLAAVLQFGSLGMTYFPWQQSVTVVLLALLAGIVLAVGGAILPAWQSAMMKPIDALRVDE